MAIPSFGDTRAAASVLVKTAALAEKRAEGFDAAQLLEWAKANPELAGTVLAGSAGGLGGLLSDFGKRREERTPMRSALSGALAGGLLGLGGGLAYRHGPKFMESLQAEPPESAADIETPHANPYEGNADLQTMVEQALLGNTPPEALPEGAADQINQFLFSPAGRKFMIENEIFPANAEQARPLGEPNPVHRQFDPSRGMSEQFKELGVDMPGFSEEQLPPLPDHLSALMGEGPAGREMARRLQEQQALRNYFEQHPGPASLLHNPFSAEGAVQYGGPAAVGASRAYQDILHPGRNIPAAPELAAGAKPRGVAGRAMQGIADSPSALNQAARSARTWDPRKGRFWSQLFGADTGTTPIGGKPAVPATPGTPAVPATPGIPVENTQIRRWMREGGRANAPRGGWRRPTALGMFMAPWAMEQYNKAMFQPEVWHPPGD